MDNTRQTPVRLLCGRTVFRTERSQPTPVCGRPTKLSSPPPSRSTAPICIPEVAAGAVAGGVRSRLSRSPRRSPWDGMTAGGTSDAPAVEPVSGLSTLSPLNKTERHQRLSLLWSLLKKMHTYDPPLTGSLLCWTPRLPSTKALGGLW